MTDIQGERHKFEALLDTGAPASEFSDTALHYAGLLQEPIQDVPLHQGLPTQKYSRLLLPSVEVCSHRLCHLNVYVSRFEQSWGIKALIGLDFFRHIKVTIDYQHGHLITQPYG